MRLAVEWRRLKSLLVRYSGGFVDTQAIVAGLRGKRYVPHLYLASDLIIYPMQKRTSAKRPSMTHTAACASSMKQGLA